MLRPATVVVAGLALAVVAVGAPACSGDDDPDGGTSADDLAERVVAVLEADSSAVDGDLEGADVSCPPVRDPQPGDRATCDVRLDGGGDLEVDVEFGEGGAITVVAVIPG